MLEDCLYDVAAAWLLLQGFMFEVLICLEDYAAANIFGGDVAAKMVTDADKLCYSKG